MNKLRMIYFDQEDVLHLVLADAPEAGSVELGPDIVVKPPRAKTPLQVHSLPCDAH
jgi:hypothetical protein